MARPHAAQRYEWQLTAVDGLGLTDIEMDHAAQMLDGIAATAVRARQAVVDAERRSGQTELEWWHTNAEPLREAMGDRSFPLANRIGQAVGDLYQAAAGPDQQFRFTLDRAIDGLIARSTQ